MTKISVQWWDRICTFCWLPGLLLYIASKLASLTELKSCLITDIGRFLLCISVRKWRRLQHEHRPLASSFAISGSACIHRGKSGWYMAPENSSNVSGTQPVILGKLLKFLKKQ